jgi:prepilin-type N-terminal cleavage/methylation domain-containing protein
MKSNRKAFTLIEMITVMAMVAILSVAGIASYRGIRRGAEIRAAESMIRTSVVMARQQAVLLRESITLSFNSNSGTNYIALKNGVNILHNTLTFPSSIEFEAPLPGPITFEPHGSGGAKPPVVVKLRERTGVSTDLLSSEVTIWPLTGVTKIK